MFGSDYYGVWMWWNRMDVGFGEFIVWCLEVVAKGNEGSSGKTSRKSKKACFTPHNGLLNVRNFNFDQSDAFVMFRDFMNLLCQGTIVRTCLKGNTIVFDTYLQSYQVCEAHHLPISSLCIKTDICVFHPCCSYFVNCSPSKVSA